MRVKSPGKLGNGIITIRVQDHRLVALELPDGHLHGPDHHLPILPMMHRTAHDELAEQVQHDAQVQLSFIRLDLGDVCYPLGLGSSAVKSRSSQLGTPGGGSPG